MAEYSVGQTKGCLTVMEVNIIGGCPIYKVHCKCGRVTHMSKFRLHNSKVVTCGCNRARKSGYNKRAWTERTQEFWERHIRGNPDIDPVWNNFAQFFADTGNKQVGYLLKKLRDNEPLGPSNFKWIETPKVVPRGKHGPSFEELARRRRDYLSPETQQEEDAASSRVQRNQG